jgi:hypothetical protein
MSDENKRILIITAGISLVLMTYLFTQNTGFNACYKQAIKSGAFTEGQAVFRCSSSN